MNCLRKNLSLLLCLMVCLGSAQEIRFKHLNINDGLSQNAVFSIAQDQEGFMWFGTKDGLNKYDGYHFTVYQHNPNDTTSLDANYINSLFCDSRGMLWVGTESGILNRFEKKTNTFQRIALPLEGAKGFNNFEIKVITEDRDGNIWAGTRNNGLFRIQWKEGPDERTQIKQIHRNTQNNYPLSDNTIRDIYTDEKGFLWIATNNGLDRFDPKTEEIRSFYINVKNKDAPASNSDPAITDIHGKGNGFLWLGTLSGLIKFDTTTFDYRVFPHHLSVFRYGWGEITEIVEDRNGDLWLASSAELMRFHPETQKYDSFKNDPFQSESLSFNSVSSLFIDRSGITWIGTTGMGIDYYDPKSHRFGLLKNKNKQNSRISSFSITSILEENERYVWISGEVIYRWDRQTGELISFEGDSNFPYLFGNTSAWSMVKSQQGDLWFSGTAGLFRVDPTTGKNRIYKFHPEHPAGIPQKDVYTVFEDANKDLWIVTENFLSKMIDRENGIFEHYRYVEGPEFHIYTRPVLLDEGKDKLWLGTKSGLLLFDKSKGAFQTFLNNPEDPGSLINNHIKCLTPDPVNPDRFLWAGTSGGLELFDKSKQTFLHFTEKDGLPNNVVYGILADKDHNLWLSTNKGISKFDPKERSFRNFDVEDGLQSNEFNTGAFYKSESGELFFGGIEGVNYFFPEQIENNTYVPPIAFTGLNVYSKSADNRTQNSFKKISLFDKDQLTFNDEDDIITFSFSALDFSSPGKNQFAYKMDNLHEDWIYINNQNTATFTNLPPGNYSFHVKGSNNDGVWNEQGTSIPIRVLPHWSATWWAYLMYTLVLLSLLYYIRKREMKRLAIKSQLELEKIETDSLRELDQLKSRFFTNISHEFRTPLTLIAGQSQVLLEKLKSLENRQRVQRISEQAKRLMDLINQILDLAKLESGKMQLNPQQDDIVLFVKNLFYAFESLAKQKNISLYFFSKPGQIQMVYDREKMEKIMVNLISNAIKFTDEGGEITLKIRTDQTDFIKVSLEDNGIGIAENQLPFIFDRFYQADNSDTKRYEGTGVGLALAKEFVELHKGSIKVKSGTGDLKKRGTTFVLKFPLGELEMSGENPNAGQIPPASPEVLDGMDFHMDKNSKIILLAEDNKDIRAFIVEQLKEKYRILEAGNGVVGIQLAEKHIPDLIITDVMMPQLDGYNMVKSLRDNEKTNHIPIIMLTGKGARQDKLEGLETGVDVYLTKPFDLKELKLHIKNLIRQREQLREKFTNKLVILPDEVSNISLDQQFLEKTLKVIDENLDDPAFGVDQLAEEVCLSTSQLHRKLNALIDQAPGQLIRNLRLQKAAELIKEDRLNLSEICFKTGFNDQAYFSRAFKSQFGCSPSAYKKEFSSS